VVRTRSWLALSAVPLVAGLGIAALPATANAWGGHGHELVCEIAYAELDPRARVEVDRLLVAGRRGMRKSEGKAALYRRYGASCAWPDKRPRERGQSHYINTERDAESISAGDCGSNPTCLLSAIEHDRAVLRDPDATDRDKLTALMYLGHWVGDLHQPLHVSYGDDRGGNQVEAEGHACRRSRSLHAVWDHCLVRAGLGAPAWARRMARKLWEAVRAGERASWRASLDPTVWANESYAIARQPSVGYCIEREGACAYDPQRRVHG